MVEQLHGKNYKVNTITNLENCRISLLFNVTYDRTFQD